MRPNFLVLSVPIFFLFSSISPKTGSALMMKSADVRSHQSFSINTISESIEHVEEGDLSLEPSSGYLLLDSHDIDLPQHAQPISTWPTLWQELYRQGSSDQKRLLTEGLSYGEIIALSGDLYETYEDLASAPLQEIYELLPLIHAPLVTTKELQMVTGGRYLALARTNQRHFSNVPENNNNLATWKLWHIRALIAARDGDARRAWGLSAAAAHFLTDAFCGGHVKVPRASFMDSQVGNLYSKILHDLDNEAGVLVNNLRSDGPWMAFGDALLHDPRNHQNLVLILEAVRLAKKDIETALMMGKNYPIPTEKTEFLSETLVPFPVDIKDREHWQPDKYAYTSLGLARKGWSRLGTAVLIASFMTPKEPSKYGYELLKLATKELPSYLEGLIHEDDYARNWVNRYSINILQRQPSKEKARLLLLLMDDWISDDDKRAIRKITASITNPSEAKVIRELIFNQRSSFLEKAQTSMTEMRLFIERGLSKLLL